MRPLADRPLVVNLSHWAPGHRTWAKLHARARPLDPRGGWLILAPHPDDEALGAGALATVLIRRGERVRLAVLTDGSGSHPGSPGWSPARLAGLRRGEAGAAGRALGIDGAVLHLGWRDAAPEGAGTAAFVRTARRLAVHCRRHRLANLAVTWGGDPHCDHEAAAALARAVPGVRVFEYIVWGWTRPDIGAASRTACPRRLTTAAGRPAARRALGCHRSQLGGRVPPGPDAFRLPRAMRRLIDRPATLLLEA